MYKILLLSHGEIAKGFYDTLPMLLGTQEDVACICLNETTTPEMFQAQVETCILQTWENYEVLILADMMNGTPSRVGIQVLSQSRNGGEVICGLNLHLILDAYMKRNSNIKEVVDSILLAGQPSFLRLQGEECVHSEDE